MPRHGPWAYRHIDLRVLPGIGQRKKHVPDHYSLSQVAFPRNPTRCCR
jgi:hypothetical protein